MRTLCLVILLLVSTTFAETNNRENSALFPTGLRYWITAGVGGYYENSFLSGVTYSLAYNKLITSLSFHRDSWPSHEVEEYYAWWYENGRVVLHDWEYSPMRGQTYDLSLLGGIGFQYKRLNWGISAGPSFTWYEMEGYPVSHYGWDSIAVGTVPVVLDLDPVWGLAGNGSFLFTLHDNVGVGIEVPFNVNKDHSYFGVMGTVGFGTIGSPVEIYTGDDFYTWRDCRGRVYTIVGSALMAASVPLAIIATDVYYSSGKLNGEMAALMWGVSGVTMISATPVFLIGRKISRDTERRREEMSR